MIKKICLYITITLTVLKLFNLINITWTLALSPLILLISLYLIIGVTIILSGVVYIIYCNLNDEGLQRLTEFKNDLEKILHDLEKENGEK